MVQTLGTSYTCCASIHVHVHVYKFIFWTLVTRALCREIVYCGRSLCNQPQNASGSLPGMCYGCEKCLECSWTCVYKVVYSGCRGLVIVVEQSSAEVLAITWKTMTSSVKSVLQYTSIK